VLNLHVSPDGTANAGSVIPLGSRTGTRLETFARLVAVGPQNRRGTLCQCPAMANGWCRLHGGLSTGPKTLEGVERIGQAVTKHWQYSKWANAVVEALYRVRDSDKVMRLIIIKPLTPKERTEVWKRVGERVDADKAQGRKGGTFTSFKRRFERFPVPFGVFPNSFLYVRRRVRRGSGGRLDLGHREGGCKSSPVPIFGMRRLTSCSNRNISRNT
jgi:hypothetical protein